MNTKIDQVNESKDLSAPSASSPLNALVSELLVDHPQTSEQLRRKAEALWGLLDDISTAFDMFKPDMENFERYVLRKCEERRRHFQSDGYDLFATSEGK